MTAKKINTDGMTARDLLLAMDPLHDGAGCTATSKRFGPRSVELTCACGVTIARTEGHLETVGVTLKTARRALQFVPEAPN